MAPTPDITESIPSLLSARKVSADGEAAGVQYDVVISGIGLVLDIATDRPYLRESSPTQKQQIDTSTEAGEQSLDGAWIRSQTSWHLGAGADYYEPGNRDETVPSKFRFKDSRGVNVWDQGRLTLHRAMEPVSTTATSVQVVSARYAGGDAWFSLEGNSLYRHVGGTTTLQDDETLVSSDYAIANAGSVILMGGGFGIYQAPVAGGVITALCTQSLGTGCQPYWAKGRIITTRGNALHEHSLAGGAIDSTSLIFDHPDTGWTWAGVAETPDAILAAGYSGGTSAVYALVLTEDAGGSVPKLGQPFQVAELPPGEEIRSIRSYLGKYLGIGTTSGIRVAVIGDRGQIQYGPLLVETDAPVVSLGARDSFLYAATGNSVIRVNLAEPIGDSLRFPYAYDVELPAGNTISSLSFDGVSSRVVLGANGVGTFAQSATDYVPSGWLESGSVRYGTTAPKAFRSLDLSATTDANSSVSALATTGGSALPLVTLSNGKSGTGITLSPLPTPLEAAGYKLVLAGTTTTPTVEMVSVKAVPVPKKRRLIQYPVQCVDRGRDPRNIPYGREGYASDLLAALEGLEDSQTIVTVNDKSRPEQYEGVIEKVEFARVAPTAGSGKKNFGGVAKITVATA